MAAKPQSETPQLVKQAPGRNSESEPVKSGEQLPDLLRLNGSDILSLRDSHSQFVSQILAATAPKLEYKPNSNGIVTSAGGCYFPPLLVALRMLRRTGSTLPVEVFLSNEWEYEPLMCEEIFPSLNARCIVVSKFISSSPVPFRIEKFQLKIFAILFSSFQNVLFLDADNFPSRNPDELFSTAPFRKATKSQSKVIKEAEDNQSGSGLVIWRDYWVPSVSPLFPVVATYSVEDSIYGGNVPPINESVILHRPTAETGQLLVDKSMHTSTLLLTAYYNVYGHIYYKLLSQGGPGEGDKETFPAAALVLGKPMYTLRTPPRPLGMSGEGAIVLQGHPGEDWAATEGKEANALFVHASAWPKLNAARYLVDHRQWGSREQGFEKFGSDIEAVVRAEMVQMACDQNINFNDWDYKINVEDKDIPDAQTEHAKLKGGICEKAKDTFKKMFGWEYNGVEEEARKSLVQNLTT